MIHNVQRYKLASQVVLAAKYTCQSKRESGLTLIEFMLALVLGLLILSAMLGIFLSAEKNLSWQEGLHQSQDNMRFALTFLSNDIRMAGFIGCAKFDNSFPFVNHTQTEFNPQNKIEYFDTPKKKSSTDAITVRRTGEVYSHLVRSMDDYLSMYVMPAHFNKDDIVIISNCKNADMFQIEHLSMTKDGMQKITSAVPLSALYDKNSEVSRVEIHHYFIADSGLYFQNDNNRKIELAENFTDFKIQLQKNEQGEISGVHFALQLAGGKEFPAKWWYGHIGIRT